MRISHFFRSPGQRRFHSKPVRTQSIPRTPTWTPLIRLSLAWFLSTLIVGAAVIRIDGSRAPEVSSWAQSAQGLAQEWYPRIGNLLLTADFSALPNVTIQLNPKMDGVAATAGNDIQMSAQRIMELPVDSQGALIHELVHVVQAYPPGQEGWVTEGIADYIRYAIYESLPLSGFPRPEKAQGYRDSYKVAAGFLFWLECGPAPGIVRQLNSLLRHGGYQESIFKDRTGRSLDRLWNEYLAAFHKLAPLPLETAIWRHNRGSFEHQKNGEWVEVEQGKKTWVFEETGRTQDSITLHDKGRNIRLRITHQEVQLFTQEGWQTLYRGDWASTTARP